MADQQTAIPRSPRYTRAAATAPAGVVEDLPVPDPPSAAPRPAAQFTIHAMIDDFPFDVAFTGSADQLASTVRRLRELGAVPPTQAARAAIAAERERDAPICQDEACDCYGKALRESSKQPGSYYCPGKTGYKAGKPIYCKSK